MANQLVRPKTRVDQITKFFSFYTVLKGNFVPSHPQTRYGCRSQRTQRPRPYYLSFAAIELGLLQIIKSFTAEMHNSIFLKRRGRSLGGAESVISTLVVDTAMVADVMGKGLCIQRKKHRAQNGALWSSMLEGQRTGCETVSSDRL